MKKFYILLAILISFTANFALADADFQAKKAAKAPAACPSPCPAAAACPAIPACPAAAPCPAMPAIPSPCVASHGATGHANDDKFIFNRGGFGMVGRVGSEPSIGLAVSPFNHMLISGSVGLGYTGDGFIVGSTNKYWDWSLGLSLEYMVIDSCPFATGPQVAAVASFTDATYDQVVITPGWNFWYSPFNAPVGIGTTLGVDITLKEGHKPSVNLQTPGLKLVYIFN